MHTDPIGLTTKANSNNRRGWSHYGLALVVLCMLAVPAVAQTCAMGSCPLQPAFNLSAFYGGQNININKCITKNVLRTPLRVVNVRGLTPSLRLLATRHKPNSPSLPAA